VESRAAMSVWRSGSTPAKVTGGSASSIEA
jgi:hypothetical protein